MPTISVIVTTFNRKDLVKETIQAILNQSYTDFELIIVDNNSDYDFMAMLSGFDDSRIKGFQNRNNGIIAVNRNFGIKRSTGAYIAFCDDDDVWLPEKLEKQINLVSNFSGTKNNHLVYCNTILFGVGIKESQTEKTKINSFDDFIKGNTISFSTVFLPNDPLLSFNEDPNLRASEDFNLWVELLLNGYQFHLINAPLVKYRVSSNSASAPNREINALRYIYVLLNNIIKFRNVKFNYFLFVWRVNLLIIKYLIGKNIR